MRARARGLPDNFRFSAQWLGTATAQPAPRTRISTSDSGHETRRELHAAPSWTRMAEGKGEREKRVQCFPLSRSRFLPSFLPSCNTRVSRSYPSLVFFAKCSLRTSPRGYERVARELDLLLRPPTPDLTFGTSFSPFFSLASPPLSSLSSGPLLVLPKIGRAHV